MSYCDADNVKEEFKSVDFEDENSAIQTDRVDRFIEEASAEMDASIGMIYQVPVSLSAACAPLLRQICIALVSDRVREILEVKTAKSEEEQDNGVGSAKWARDYLVEIKKSNVNLAGATMLNASGGSGSFNAKSGVEREFKVGVKQW